jgi:hypothetical protein
MQLLREEDRLKKILQGENPAPAAEDAAAPIGLQPVGWGKGSK